MLPVEEVRVKCGFVGVVDSKKKADDEAEWEREELRRRRCIWVTGQAGLTEYEAAEMIVREARKLLADDLLEMGVDWKPTDNHGV